MRTALTSVTMGHNHHVHFSHWDECAHDLPLLKGRGGDEAHATQILEITCQRTVSVSELSLEISSDRARALVRACFYCMNFSVSLSFNDNYFN